MPSPSLADLKNADFRVRVQACLALGASADMSAIPALAGALRDSHSQVRSAAVAALAKLGSKASADGRRKVVDALWKALNDPDSGVRGLAQNALGQLGAARAAP